MSVRNLNTVRFVGAVSWLLCGLAFLATSAAHVAHAQIKSPGAHEHYAAELEPHLVYQWSDQPWWNDDGIGVGFRASIPVIQDGPVKTINNNLAISFGLDWAHFGNCGPYNNDICSANDFWVPIVVQWNFFLSDVVSVFPELGLAVQHSSLSWNGPVPGGCQRVNGYNVCVGDSSHTDLQPVLWLGARFTLARSFALTVRLGTPSLLLGAAFNI